MESEWDEFAEFLDEAKAGPRLEKAAPIAIKIMETISSKATASGFLKTLTEKLEMPENLKLGGPVPRLNHPIFKKLTRRGKGVDKRLQQLQQTLMLPYVALARVADKAVNIGGAAGDELKNLAFHGMRAAAYGVFQIHQGRMANTAESLSPAVAEVLQKKVVPTQMFGEWFFKLSDVKLQETIVTSAKGNTEYDRITSRDSSTRQNSHRGRARSGFRRDHQRDGHLVGRKDKGRRSPSRDRGRHGSNNRSFKRRGGFRK